MPPPFNAPKGADDATPDAAAPAGGTIAGPVLTMPLRIFLPLILFLVLVVIVAIAAGSRVVAVSHTLDEHLTREARFLTERLQASVSQFLLEGNPTDAKRLLRGFASHRNIRLLAITDERGALVMSSTVAHTRPAPIIARYCADDGLEAPATGVRIVPADRIAGAYCGRATLRIGHSSGRLRPDRTGTLHAVFDYGELIRNNDNAQWTELVRLGAAFLALTVALYMILLVRVARPIEDLVACARAFSAGEHDQRVALRQRDEIGALGDALTHMMDEINREAERQRLLVAALDASPSPIVILCPDDHCVHYANQAFAALVGAAGPTALAGRPLPFRGGDPASGDLAAASRARVAEALADATTLALEAPFRRPDGREIRCAVQIGPVRDDAGGLLAFVGVFIDRTESHRHEARLKELQRLKGLSAMTGGLAHEINNLLQPILTFSTLTRGLLTPGSKADSHQRKIEDSARQASAIIRKALTYARGGARTVMPIDLVCSVPDLVAFAATVLPDTVRLDLSTTGDPVVVRADQIELSQLLINLLTNAADAMDNCGVVTVRLTCGLLGGARAARLGLVPGRFAELKVTDTGCGMDEETRRRCTEPFFTTKPVNRGTGLGLAVAAGILKSWGGALDITSRPGTGTTVAVIIPSEADPCAPDPGDRADAAATAAVDRPRPADPVPA